jgi:RHS repeat-associated protein
LLKQITYPSGGYVSYIWGLNKESAGFSLVIPQGENTNPEYCGTLVDQPAITQRSVSFDGKTVALTQAFAYNSGQIGATGDVGCSLGPYTTTVTTTDNVANLTYDTVYTYNATYNSPPNEQYLPECLQYYPGTEKSILYYGNTNTSGTPLLAVTKGWASPASLSCEMHTLDNGEISGVFNSYEGTGTNSGQFQLLLSKSEYTFGLLSGTCGSYTSSGPSITPTRETTISYHSFAAQPLFFEPSPGGILTLQDRPSGVFAYGNVGGTLTEVAATNYSYDQTSVSSVTATDHDETNYSSSSTAPRGNATTKVVQCLQGCQGQTTTYAYNELGQITSTTDPCGNTTCGDVVGTNHTTTFSYNDSYTIGTPPGNTNAYLTTITNPLAQTHSFSYAYSSGELTAAKDENLQQTLYTYSDPFIRLTQASYPDGGETNYSYNDAPYSTTTPSPSVTTTKAITSSLSAVNVAAADGMGHLVQAQFPSDPDGEDFTFTTYDGLGQKHSVTNPYRSTSDSTYGTTTYTYDALGRVTLVAESDGSTIQTSYCGPSTLVTDEAGHWRRRTTDGLGRLIEVDEPNSTTASVTACPQSSDPIVATTYTYDVLNDLTGVIQGGSRQRTFAYDSLSQLVAACNPEDCSGTGTITLPGGNASGTITIGCASSCTGAKVLVYVNGTTPGDLCATFFTAGESVSAVAAATASTIEGSDTCGKYVTASASGAVVTLTSKVSGSAGDYPFSASTNGTYTATTSGSNLVQVGGQTVTGGSTLYAYDANGNLSSKVGPAQNQTGSSTVTLSYCYDGINRMTSKAYTAQSCPQTAPVATYSYDSSACLGQASCYNVGHSTGMTDVAGSESWSYDQMGRVLTDQRTTNSVTKSTVYTYAPYVDGSLYTLQYPSGRTITYNTGAAERPLSASDTTNSIYYVTGAHYAPQGALSSLTNNDNVFSTELYNKRLQPCWSYVTTGTALATNTACTATDSTAGNILDLQYNFSLGSGDNGNVVGITNNHDTTRNQTFTYDWLNRIATAETTSTDSTSSAHCWSQVFGYDVWANLLNIQGGASVYNGCTQPSTLSVNVTTQNQINGYTYDAAGNLNTIPGAGGTTYSYDTENHLTSTAGLTYVYDGEGKRVEKSGSKIYWYGSGGKVLDETNTTGAIGGSISTSVSSITYTINPPGTCSGTVVATVASTAGMSAGDSITITGDSLSLESYINQMGTITGPNTVNFGEYTGWYCSDTTGSGGTLTDTASDPTFSEYVYFGGERIARRDSSGDVYYYFADDLGTARTMAQVLSGQTTATLCYDGDFYPFGGERAYTDTCPQNYKFTGKERDSESGLDDFEARYYASTMGRFLSPDWAERPTAVPYAVFGDPQSLNLYTYLRNDPVTSADLDGHGAPGQSAQSGPPAPDSGSCGPLDSPKCQEKANAKQAADAATAAVQNTQAQKEEHSMFYYMFHTNTSGTDNNPGAKCDSACYNSWMAFHEMTSDLGGVYGAIAVGGSEVPTERGVASEARVLDDLGETKNTEPVTGSQGKKSIPDFQNSKQIGEIKDAKNVSNTEQLRIQKEAAKKSGREHVVVTGTNTHVTKPAANGTTVVRRHDLGPQ